MTNSNSSAYIDHSVCVECAYDAWCVIENDRAVCEYCDPQRYDEVSLNEILPVVPLFAQVSPAATAEWLTGKLPF